MRRQAFLLARKRRGTGGGGDPARPGQQARRPADGVDRGAGLGGAHKPRPTGSTRAGQGGGEGGAVPRLGVVMAKPDDAAAAAAAAEGGVLGGGGGGGGFSKNAPSASAHRARP